ncbi:MAG: hypothetical protein HW405_718 [Candidatus Berkelbacteria bacterium]|nr:hypothetical protein [Candidatus Berkelbacteria bacterium]
MSDDVQDPMAGDNADTDTADKGEETAAPTEGGVVPPVPGEAPAGDTVVAPAEGEEVAGEDAAGAGDEAGDDAGDVAEE